MASSTPPRAPALPPTESAGRTAASVAFSAAATYVVVQILQVAGVLRNPWGAAGVYATSLGIAIPYAVAMVALHNLTPSEHRFWSGVAVTFAAMYALFATFNYVVQLSVVIPFDSSDTIINQSPHTMFWAVDALAYIMLGLSIYFAYRLFWRPGVERWTRGFFLANAAATPLICVVYFYPIYSNALLVVGSPWGVTAPGAMLTLALYFSSRMRLVEHVSEDRTRRVVASPR